MTPPASLVRMLLRVLTVAGIVLACGAATCEKHPVGDIRYAPGYGYVVKAEQRGTTYQRDHSYYFVFPTEERAREFYGAYYSDPNWPKILREGERQIYDDDDEFDEITKLLDAPPQVPLAIPDLPQPIPQIPQ